MKKRKGFTLAELLAVIVILGIITSITVPIVTDQIDKYKTKVCISQYDNILNAARSYGADHLTELGKSQTITLRTLNDGGYIDASNMKDPITKNTISQNLKIIIEKVGKKYKYFLSNNEDIGCKDDYNNFYDKSSLFLGIPSKKYTTGERLGVEYLGHKWIVMRDNGTSTQLVMDGYLSADELKTNLPSNIDRSKVSSSGTMSMCQESSENYCGYYGGTDKPYSWKTSLIKPTLDNWLDNKMKDYSLDKTLELKGMSFSDVNGTINDYVRVPLYDEAKEMNGSCGAENGNIPYCPDESHYLYTGYTYWLIGATDYGMPQAVLVDGMYKGAHSLYKGSAAYVRPVITVNEN